MKKPIPFDVIVCGAGPAGTTCALALKGSGLNVAVLDKAAFPRDKVCGDAIGGRCETVLESLSPDYARALESFSDKQVIRGCRGVAPNGKSLTFAFQRYGSVSRRMDFDRFLYDLAKAESGAHFFPNAAIQTVRADRRGAFLKAKDGRTFQGRLLVGADGAHSVVAKQLAGYAVDKAHYAGAVRRYYRGVQPFEGNDCLEFFFADGFLPGYFWVFPLPEGAYNVGFGMLSKAISRKRMNLAKGMEALIERNAELRRRFSKAEPLGKTVGFGLPFGSKRPPASGESWLLTGDAAALIDPASGEGIGNAMLSGKLAAEAARRAFATEDFDLSGYGATLEKAFGAEMRRGYWAQRLLFDRRWLWNLLATLSERPVIKRQVRKWLV